MKYVTTVAVCLLLAWTCLNANASSQVQVQAPPSSPAQVRDAAKPVPPPTGKGRISGSVKDERGEPVRRAAVTISGDMRLNRTAMTDEQGHFSLSDLPAGRFSVTATKPGYPQVSHGAKRPFRPGAGIFLQEGEQVSDIALMLARGGVLTGTVYDEEGTPMPGVPVMAWEVRTALNGERTLGYAGEDPVTVITDDQGTYRVFGLPPGVFTVGTSWYYQGDRFEVRTPTAAELRSAFSQTNQAPRPSATPSPTPVPDPPRFNYSPVFSPGVLDPLASETFTLKPGEVRAGVDLRMQFQPTSRIEGTIVDPRGAPIGVELSLTRRTPVKALGTTTVRPGHTDSRFTFGSLPPGLYTVAARTRTASQGAMMWASADVSLSGGDPIQLTLTLQPAAIVGGRVTFEGTELAPPADLANVSVRFIDVGPRQNFAGATVDSAGALTAPGIVPGRFMVRAAVPGGLPPTGPAWTVRSVTVGGIDVTDRAFDISAGGASDLVVTFTSQISELSGTLTTAAGAEETDYFVIAMPADRTYWQPSSRRIVSTRPDGKGRYVLRGLPAGDYRIAVTTDLVPSDLQEISTLESLLPQSLPVTIATGERKTLNIKTAGEKTPLLVIGYLLLVI